MHTTRKYLRSVTQYTPRVLVSLFSLMIWNVCNFLTACAQCGRANNGDVSCCGKGGSWEGKCGGKVGGSTSQYTWGQGKKACETIPPKNKCPPNMIKPSSCECGTVVTKDSDGCQITKCKDGCQGIHALGVGMHTTMRALVVGGLPFWCTR